MNARPQPDALVTAPPVLRDHLWQELTAAANAAFQSGDFGSAEALYHRALAEAEILFATRTTQRTGVPLPAIVNIACHNLAQLAAQTGDVLKCRGFLLHAFDLLLAAARQPETPIALRIACIGHLKYTIAELAAHLLHAPDPDHPIGHYVGQLRSVAAAVSHVAAHMEHAQKDPGCEHCGLIN